MASQLQSNQILPRKVGIFRTKLVNVDGRSTILVIVHQSITLHCCHFVLTYEREREKRRVRESLYSSVDDFVESIYRPASLNDPVVVQYTYVPGGKETKKAG
jgi:hypothetical protein